MSLLKTVQQIAPYLERWLEYGRDFQRIPGVQVAVRVGDELAASFALGQANEDTGEALTPRHLFRIASHSKTFTATAVFQLIEAGKLRLDDGAAHWLPELEGSPAAHMTVRALLGHQSGINRDGADSDYWQQMHAFPDRQTLLEFARADAVFVPDQHFKYSNIGYGLLGLIVEAAAGQSYGDYVQQHITGPLGLTDLGAELPPEREAELATGHSARLAGNDPRRTLPSSDTRALAAATGFYGTAEALTAYWARHALGREGLISDASKRLMGRRESEIIKPNKRGYGLGLILDDIGGRGLVGHSGGFPGHITQSWLDPKTGLSISVLTNTGGGPATEWAGNLIRLIDLAHKNAEKPAETADAAHDLDSFTGRFANNWGVFDIANLGGRLVALTPLGDPTATATELTVQDANTLSSPPESGFGSVGEPYHFQRAEDGTGDGTGKGEIQWVRQGGGKSWPLTAYRAQAGLD
ncbi:serine hydrolase domain-containing protein [Deinococcus arenicola]|uniref:Serine hydrolase n=1 Tax=Deinococcus arenicola TaxID=2994950 RepID=A0ABU4DKR8_9DEIO|nr:serine hydrolase domain-containing protein [Deinococcus sp. ZS9-10]MDV6373021.1 serine hydrolase [Deinococcus sp. ZS9-10]